MKNTRIVFDESYYVLQGILQSKKFQKILSDYKLKMKKAGYEIPQNGFKDVKTYNEWLDQLSKKNIDPYDFVDSSINEFDIKMKTEQIATGLKWHVFFGENRPPLIPTVSYSSEINKEKNYIDVKLRFYAWSTKKEINEIWEYLNSLRTQLPAYKGVTKNKVWENFERDFEVYELFLRVKKDIKNGILRDSSGKSKSPYQQIFYYPEFEIIQDKYKSQLDDQIPSIVSRCNKVFKNLNLL